MTRIIRNLSEISDQYDALYCDLWGCLHDGVAAHPEAVAALRLFKSGGGQVILLSNSPRPAGEVAKQIRGMNVPDDCWDRIVTSGDAAQRAMFEGRVGNRVWFIGVEETLPFFDAPEDMASPAKITRVELQEAEGIVCTGPFDTSADPEAMRPEFEKAIGKGLPFLCANPDIVVDRGGKREWCAGALAKLYREMGGKAHYFGKPEHAIYDLAADGLAKDDARILAIGDGIATDILGAAGRGIDALFVTGGLARSETRTDRDPDADALDDFLARHDLDPAFSIGSLR
jgi:HAD superfamily hydrolase (TIGR01459 family)